MLEGIDYSQTHIEAQILKCFAAKGHPYHFNHGPTGLCFGYTVLWSYATWLSLNISETERHAQPHRYCDAVWFWSTLRQLSLWNGENPDDIFELALDFISLLAPHQSPNYFLNGMHQRDLSLWFTDNKGRSFLPQDHRVLAFDPKFKADYTSDIESFFGHIGRHIGQPIIIITADHAVGLYFTSKYKGMFYDTNNRKGTKFFKNLSELSTKMIHFLADYNEKDGITLRRYSIGMTHCPSPLPSAKIEVGKSVTIRSLDALSARGILIPRASMTYATHLISKRPHFKHSIMPSLEIGSVASNSDIYPYKIRPFSKTLAEDSEQIRTILSTIINADEKLFPEYYLALAIVHKADGKTQEAKEQFDLYFQFDWTTTYSFAWIQYAECLLKNGDFEECLRFCNQTLACLDLNRKEKGDYYFVSSQAALEAGFYTDALDLAVQSFQYGREDMANFICFFKAFEEVYGTGREAALHYLKDQEVIIKFPHLSPSATPHLKSAAHAFWATRPLSISEGLTPVI